MTTSWQVEALGVSIEVASDCPLSTPKLQVLLAGYERAHGRALSSYCFKSLGTSVRLSKNGVRLYEDQAEDTLNFFLLDLYRSLVIASTRCWLLHAAGVVRDGRALVLAGPSNAGKSTMTRALLRTGWSYLSEEIVSLAPDRVDGLRRPLHLGHPGELEGIGGFTPPCQIVSGSAPVWVSAPLRHRPPADHVRAIVRLSYEPQDATSMVRLLSSEALMELWPCRMNTGLEVAGIAAAVVSNVPCYRLIAADEDSALRHLIDL